MEIPQFALLATQNSQEEEKLEKNLNNPESSSAIRSFNEIINCKLRPNMLVKEILMLAPGVATAMSGNNDMFIYFNVYMWSPKEKDKWKNVIINALFEDDILAIPVGNMCDPGFYIMEIAQRELTSLRGNQWLEKALAFPATTETPKESVAEFLLNQQEKPLLLTVLETA